MKMDAPGLLEIGDFGEISFVASDRDMASALALSDDDNFPEVFATSRMVALMEVAAARVMNKALAARQLSVGVGVYIKHLAATPNHTEVRGVATFLGREGKLYKFKVQAFDTAGLIGEGEHTRAIIDADRLVQGAQARGDPQHQNQ
jgi:fluoroacetyl-CoA thioesterase